MLPPAGRAEQGGALIPGRQGWGLEGYGVGTTTPKLCCLLVDSHKRQPKGLRGGPRHTSFFHKGSRQVAFPRDWGPGRQGQAFTPAHPAPWPQNAGDSSAVGVRGRA